MNSRDIRRSFLDFFTERGHQPVASSPLVPHGDPTLLFTNAGMVQFKDGFLGLDEPPAPRVVSVQKCLRVSGKHNDLENVGPSPRHHTFFEMLGNFSFGDYFKEEAIRFAWELVTGVWGISPAHLSATVYEEDEEAARLWAKVTGLPAARIHRGGRADNFWAMGETGPCGPCSEVFVDRHPDLPEVAWEEGTESGRYLELWNLVFMQYERDAAGAMKPLPNPSIDTGAGLERVAAALQGVESNYDTDLFQPILREAASLAGTGYGRDGDADVSLRVIADHLRAVAFLLADGVIPGNEGRGYVLRRILRRAVRHGMRLGFEEPFLHRLLPTLEQVMGEAYPELGATRRASEATVSSEEEKFLSTIAAGARQVQQAVEEARRRGGRELPGGAVFRLYDTYGLPLETIAEIAEEERMAIDRPGFEAALEEQRERSRQGTGETQRRLAGLRQALRGGTDLAATEFVGYDRLELPGARVLRLAVASAAEAAKPLPATSLAAGERGVAVLDKTVFYAEAGGQVGDRGEMVWPSGQARIADTQKDTTGTVFHFVEVREGRLAPGAEVSLAVDAAARRATERNHTATHLLHAALRRVLGEGVRQAGSLVAPDRLRFDFTHPRPLAEEERRRVEELVNAWVLRAADTAITWQGYREAVAAGAMALFGEKYGERVRTVAVPGVSLELCGGCHVRNTGEIGPFVIVTERGIASGVRRLEALTGEGALAFLRERQELLAGVEEELGVPAERARRELAALREQVRSLERESSRLRTELVAGGADGGGRDATEVAGVKVLAREVPPAPASELRHLADALRGRLKSGVVVLGSREEGKVTLVAAVTADLTSRLHAGDLAKRIAGLVGGSGGGRPDFAQAGGKEPERLAAALAAVPGAVEEALRSPAAAGDK